MAAIENFVLKIKVEGQKAVDDLSKSVNGLSTTIGNFGANAGKMTSAISGIIGGLGGMAAIAGTAATAFVGLGMKAIAMADELSDISDATGIASGALNNFRNSLVDAGGKTDDFSTLAAKLNQNLGDAAVGNEKAQEAFRKLGVYVTDASGAVRNTGDVLRDAISKLAAIEDPATRASLAVDLFGKTAAKLDFTKLNAANDFAKDEQIAQLAKYQTAIDKISQSISNNLLKVFGELAMEMDNAYNKSVEIEKKLNSQGKTGILSPGVRATISGALGIEPPTPVFSANISEQSKAEKAARDHLANMRDIEAENEAKRKQIASSSGPRGKESFGATPEATLKAIAESQKRIAQDSADAQKEIELRGASDIEKINIEMRANIAKATEEINSKERLSSAQKAKETLATVSKLTEKAATDTAKVREDQERSINQLKQQYAQSNNALLGQEQTEVQKITDLIAQQPAKYKEIGDQLLKNASIQDAEKKRIEETVRLRQVERENFSLMSQELSNNLNFENQIATIRAQALGVNKLDLATMQAQSEAQQKLIDLANNVTGAYEAKMIADGRINELTKEQIKSAATYNDLLATRTNIIEKEKNNKIALAELDKSLAENFAVGWEGSYARYVESSKQAADQAKTYFDTFSRGFEDAFVKMVQTGKLSFKDLANSLIADFARIQAKKALMGLMDFGGGGAGFLGGIGKIFGFANGGNPPVNRPSLVGEQGPELFVPRTAGTIVPNGQFGGGQTVNTAVTYNIQAVDASSFRTLLARDPEFIHNVAEQGRRQLPIRSRR